MRSQKVRSKQFLSSLNVFDDVCRPHVAAAFMKLQFCGTTVITKLADENVDNYAFVIGWVQTSATSHFSSLTLSKLSVRFKQVRGSQIKLGCVLLWQFTLLLFTDYESCWVQNNYTINQLSVERNGFIVISSLSLKQANMFWPAKIRTDRFSHKKKHYLNKTNESISSWMMLFVKLSALCCSILVERYGYQNWKKG